MTTLPLSTLPLSTPSLSTPTTSTHAARFRGLTLVPVKESLWRVTDGSGAVLGHIERRTGADGDRFAARRLVAAVRSMELGVFWRIDDAADCFR